jgi:hypothetical protein
MRRRGESWQGIGAFLGIPRETGGLVDLCHRSSVDILVRRAAANALAANGLYRALWSLVRCDEVDETVRQRAAWGLADVDDVSTADLEAFSSADRAPPRHRHVRSVQRLRIPGATR